MKYRYSSIASRRLCMKAVRKKRAGGGRFSGASGLVAENKELKCQIEKVRLDLAASGNKIKYFSREYDSVCNSRSWLYTAPIRAFLDAIILFRQQAGQLAVSLKRSFMSAVSIFGRPCRDWVAIANGFSGNIAIVQSADENPGYSSRLPMDFARALASTGYLVFFTSWQLGETGVVGQADLNHPGIVPVSRTDFLAAVARLRSGKSGTRLCVITAPCQSLVSQVPSLRSAGFSIIVDIVQDRETAGSSGYSCWYEKDSEEQAVLCADLVVVASPPLSEKYSHLRRDIICLDYHVPSDSDDDTAAENRCNQLLMRAASKTYMSDLYA